MTYEEVLQATREILVQSLGVSEEEVRPESHLIGELGAESIDFLDIFHLAELRLGIRVTEDDFAPEFRQADGDDEMEQDVNRRLEDHELQKLRERLPASTHSRIVPGLHAYDIISLLNVETLAQFFLKKIQARQAEGEAPPV